MFQFGWMIKLHMVIMKAIANLVCYFTHLFFKPLKFRVALWPLFHYLLWQDVATELPSVSEHWDAYRNANEAYAKKLASIYRPGDLIWVHDYHLLLIPKMFRGISKKTQDAYIGLFVHTPFPSSEVFRCLPSELTRSCFSTTY